MNHTRRLLDRASRRWEIDHNIAEDITQLDDVRSKEPPVVTISREFGAGGTLIGRHTAEKLGFAYYDREIIDEIATEKDSSTEHVARHEVGGLDALSDMLLGIMDRRHITDSVYMRSLLRVLNTIAAEGRVVIMGRGGACVIGHALRIRIVAPFDIRADRIARARDLPESEARHLVLEMDHAQERFLKSFFGCGADDIMIYDLIINTANLSVDHSADLIIMRLRQTWDEASS